MNRKRRRIGVPGGLRFGVCNGRASNGRVPFTRSAGASFAGLGDVR